MKEVVPGVSMLERSWGCNIYFLEWEGGVSLIDAGFPLDTRKIVKSLGTLTGGPDMLDDGTGRPSGATTTRS